ncbi:ABC transporter ATP-binding protein [Oscillospiraceae bacterium LTW-04]|nr:ABC transporter ATP-binding protein [Oscillospiraceae bacterium MB24-C1]
MLSVEHITKNYGGNSAIADVTFAAKSGEVVGLIGHNGSGKSTTMNIVTGYLTPTSGRVMVEKTDVAQSPLVARSKIGFMPENPPLYFDMTVEEQLGFACALRKIKRADRAAEIQRASRLADVEGARGRLIRNLSKGYRQRIGLAQALIGNPPVLILDEPTAGLDPQQILEVREVILSLRRDHTILLSSHILSEIAAVCDRLVILSNGRVVADDTAAMLLQNHKKCPRYRARVTGNLENIKALLDASGWAKSCEIQRCTSDGVQEVLFTADGAKVFESFYLIVQYTNSELTAFEPIQPSLEEVFLSLTKDHRYQK